jgi:hypothetical protein
MKAPGWPFRSVGHAQPWRGLKPMDPAMAEEGRARAMTVKENIIIEMIDDLEELRVLRGVRGNATCESAAWRSNRSEGDFILVPYHGQYKMQIGSNALNVAVWCLRDRALVGCTVYL